jgi:hypothetical protein
MLTILRWTIRIQLGSARTLQGAFGIEAPSMVKPIFLGRNMHGTASIAPNLGSTFALV